MKRWFIFVFFYLLHVAPEVNAQGSLDPATAPAPTMKTLEQLEPRTPISALPYTIYSMGSYYVTTNLSSSTNGITIEADRVTLDLGGFELSGDGGSGDLGIAVQAQQRCVIRNGVIRRFGTGVRGDFMADSRLEDLHVVDNTDDGIYLSGRSSGGSDGNLIQRCSITGNSGYGVVLSGRESSCSANRIVSCQVVANQSGGILLSGVTAPVNYNAILDTVMSENGSMGLLLYGGPGTCFGNLIRGCRIQYNEDVYAFYSSASSGNLIADNTFTGPGGVILADGEYGNRIEDNQLRFAGTSTSWGMYLAANTASNLVLRNQCFGFENAYSFDSGLNIGTNNTYGPLTGFTGDLSGSGVAANPWVNFDY